jgi:O-antigen/teichoic acid export membrane protein
MAARRDPARLLRLAHGGTPAPSVRLVRDRVALDGNRSRKEVLVKPIDRFQKPWRQLAFLLGEAALSLISGSVLFIIISRVSGPELLGTYALALAWLMMFQGVSSMGVPEYLMREVGAHGRDAAVEMVHAGLLGLGSGVVGLCLMLGTVRLLGYSPDIVKIVTIASLALIPTFLNTACRSVFLALRMMHLTFLAALIEVTIVMSASVHLLLSGYGAIALMVTLVVAKIASASIAVTMLYRRVLKVWPAFRLGSLIRTARTVFTFGIGNMLGMLTMRINTIMASVWVDIAAVGHFAAATKIMEIGLIIPNLFVQLLMTRFAYSFNTQGNRDPNQFGAWLQILFAFVVPICVGLWVFAGPILDTLFGNGFGSAVWVLRILLIYLVIESADAVMSVILRAAHRQREDVSRFAANPLTNIAVNLLLLPSLGTIGAAIGRVSGVGASATLRHLFMTRELIGVKWFRFALKPAVISVGVGSICYFLLNGNRPAWVLLFYVATTAVLLRIAAGFTLSAIKEMMSFPSSQG